MFRYLNPVLKREIEAQQLYLGLNVLWLAYEFHPLPLLGIRKDLCVVYMSD
jgi:hypothetical protein